MARKRGIQCILHISQLIGGNVFRKLDRPVEYLAVVGNDDHEHATRRHGHERNLLHRRREQRRRDHNRKAIGQARQGDLIVTCRIQPHEFFEREGDNLHARANVSFIQATLGAEIEIDGIFHDEKVMVRVPEGCQNEQVIRVKGMGMPRLKSTERGDMYVHITVLIPKKVTKKQRELLEKVAEEFGEDVAAPRSPLQKLRDAFN